MASTTSADKPGKSLVIVESPAKARTISKLLGKNYTVEASIGHIRDLPQGKKEVPEQYKNEDWARLGVNVDDDFTPVYVVPSGKKQQVSKLRKLLKEADSLYLATDEDREGEAISWHLNEVLKPKVPVRRLVFHEITDDAIQNALSNTRTIDDHLVKAQETRRILDRLYGFEISEFLWKKNLGRSAGRVQSVAVRLIVDRERSRMAFVSATYWDLLGIFAKVGGDSFETTLVSVDDRRIPAGKDFDSATGKIKNPKLLCLNEAEAGELLTRLQGAEFKVADLEIKPFTQRPAAPFTTSSMQQEANRKLGFTARRTMNAAQSLYENGHITYMRTDSTSLASVAIDAARELVSSQYGSEYLPSSPRIYKSKVKNAQEAHEAIRPAGHPFKLPESLRKTLNSDEYKLFELIWKRTIASQMEDARGKRVVITIVGGGAQFQVSGKTIDFPGFLRAYVEGSDDPAAELADKETILPTLEIGELVDLKSLEPKSHTTQPPARFSEASLTRELEQRGIGRPSTYASIIETIQARNYVFKKGNALVPTWGAFSMVRLMEEHFDSLVDYEFTAQMEDLLDAISRNEAGHSEYLHDFYFNQDKVGLKLRLENKLAEVDARATSTFPLGNGEQEGEEVAVRVGRYGPYLEQGERKASIPEDLPPDELTLAAALDLLEKASTGDEPLGVSPDTGKPIFIKSGRFGPYVQMGTADDDEKPKNASLLKGMEISDVSLEVAIRLLTLPRTVGEHPESKEPIVAHNGRYGPYIKCDAETRSLPDDISPLDVTLEKALELLAQPKTRGRAQAAPKEPIKVFDASPITEEPVRLLEGRYGPYVTDGATNASLPKGSTIEELTFEKALDLLAERAAKGGTKRKKKKSAKKKTAKKKAAKKKATKKKTTKKKATKKAAVKSSETGDETTDSNEETFEAPF